jgi:hypothetical protein
MITELARLSEILPALTQDLGWPSWGIFTDWIGLL